MSFLIEEDAGDLSKTFVSLEIWQAVWRVDQAQSWTCERDLWCNMVKQRMKVGLPRYATPIISIYEMLDLRNVPRRWQVEPASIFAPIMPISSKWWWDRIKKNLQPRYFQVFQMTTGLNFFEDQQLFISVYPQPGLFSQHFKSVCLRRRKMRCHPDLASPPSDSPFLDRIPAIH